MNLRKIFLLVTFLLFANLIYAQFGVGYQYSEVHPNIAVSYGAPNRLWGELRLAADIEISNFSPEIMGLYNFVKADDFDFYGGVGVKINLISGPLAVAGLNIYPFENKQFGFLLELGLIFDRDGYEPDSILRGLTGFRYTFNKD